MKLLTLIIWIIFFPLATVMYRYYVENSKRLLGEPKTPKELRDRIEAMETFVFVVMIIIILIS